MAAIQKRFQANSGKENHHSLKVGRRQLIGTVVSAKTAKTVIVAVERFFRHPIYKKTMKKVKRIPAHVEGATFSEGDVVRLVETRPISKTKHFVVVEKVNK